MTGDWFKVDSSFIARQSVIARAGAAMVLKRFADPYFKQGLLIAPFPYRLPVKLAHFLVRNERSLPREGVQIFCDWLTGAL